MDEDIKLSEEDKLKAENDYLQMKIMLEHGAQFHVPEGQDEELNPEIHNQFLNNIIEFEKQWDERKRITVFKKIGSPGHFPLANTIAEEAMEDEWRKLSEYLQEYGIGLDACSSRITAKELYRFTIEELFHEEIDDIQVAGYTTQFIYDEFYPDHEYDTTRFAIDDCIKLILQKSPVKFLPRLGDTGLQFNSHTALNREGFMRTVNEFKEQFDEIELTKIEEVRCHLKQDSSDVIGSYQALLTVKGEVKAVSGNWRVEFVMVDGYWDAVTVQIGNV